MKRNASWEDGQLALEEDYALVVLLLDSIFMVLILVGNGSVVVLFGFKKTLRTPKHLYIVSLCLADITVAVFSIPMEILKHFTNLDMTEGMCRLVAFFSYMATTSHLFCAVAIAVDRHRALVYPMLRKLSFNEVLRSIIVVWTVSLVYGLRSVILFDAVNYSRIQDGVLLTVTRCGVKPIHDNIQRILFIIDFLVMYLVPVVIIVVLYVRIGLALRKAENQQPKTSIGGKRKNRVIRMLCMVVIVFAVTMLPLHLWRFYVYWGPGPFHGYWVVHQFTDVSAFMNGWLNVIAYMLFHPRLRLALFPCLRSHHQIHPQTTELQS